MHKLFTSRLHLGIVGESPWKPQLVNINKHQLPWAHFDQMRIRFENNSFFSRTLGWRWLKHLLPPGLVVPAKGENGDFAGHGLVVKPDQARLELKLHSTGESCVRVANSLRFYWLVCSVSCSGFLVITNQPTGTNDQPISIVIGNALTIDYPLVINIKKYEPLCKTCWTVVNHDEW